MTDLASSQPTGASTKSLRLSAEPRRAGSFFLIVLAFAIMLQYSYEHLIAPRFGYLRYFYEEPHLYAALPAFLAAYLAGLTLRSRITTPSDIVMWAIYIVVLLPISLVPFYGGAISDGAALLLAIGCSITFVIMNWIVSHPVSTLVPINQSSRILLISFVTIFSLATYSLMLATTGLSLRLFWLTDNFSSRGAYRGTLSTVGPLVGYLISNQSNVINTMIITYGARTRNFGLVAVGALGQILVYSATGYKTAALSIPVCIAVGMLYRKKESISGRALLLATVCASVTAIAIDSIRNFDLTQVLVNRMLVTAGWLTPIYISVYEGNDKAMWSYSFLKGITPDYYGGVTPGYLIGQQFLGRPEVQANANLFADGFANLGVFGIAIEAAFLALLLLLVNSAARGLPSYLVVGTMILPGIALANGSSITAAMSYGLVLSVFVFAAVPRKELRSSKPPTGQSKPEADDIVVE